MRTISYIEIVDLHECLGTYIGNNVTFEKHIEFVQGKVVGTLRPIYSNSTYLPQVLYGLEEVAGTTAGNFFRLRRIVNSMVHYVYTLRDSEHVPLCYAVLGMSFCNILITA